MIKVTLLAYNNVTAFDNTNYNMHMARKKKTKKQIVRKCCDPKSIQKNQKQKIKLMVGYKILSFLDVIEILITTTWQMK